MGFFKDIKKSEVGTLTDFAREVNRQRNEKIAEVKLGDYYAYKTWLYGSGNKAVWFDRVGVITDSGYEMLLEELAKEQHSKKEV
jgi:hypothetical protein